MQISKILPVILAGGFGTRLAPISTPESPKQFLHFFGADKSLFQQTISRISGPIFLKPLVVANILHQKYIEMEDVDVIYERESRNTASAIAEASSFALEKYGDIALLILPSDHLLSPIDIFIKQVKYVTCIIQKEQIALFAAIPTYPEIGYGYIELGEEIDGLYRVKKFHEKPAIDLANQYISRGYLWNSGIFLLYPDNYLKIIGSYYESIPNISIDYAVIEKYNHVIAIKNLFDWWDLGSWENITNYAKQNNILEDIVISDGCAVNYKYNIS